MFSVSKLHASKFYSHSKCTLKSLVVNLNKKKQSNISDLEHGGEELADAVPVVVLLGEVDVGEPELDVGLEAEASGAEEAVDAERHRLLDPVLFHFDAALVAPQLHQLLHPDLILNVLQIGVFVLFTPLRLVLKSLTLFHDRPLKHLNYNFEITESILPCSYGLKSVQMILVRL